MKVMLSLTHIHLLLIFCSIFFSISFFFLSFSFSLMDGWIDGRRQSNLHTSWLFIHKYFSGIFPQNILLCNDNTIMLSKFNTNFKLIFIQFLPNCLYFNVVCQPNTVLYSSLFFLQQNIHSSIAFSIISLQSHLIWNTVSVFVFYDTFLKEHRIAFLNRNTPYWTCLVIPCDQIRDNHPLLGYSQVTCFSQVIRYEGYNLQMPLFGGVNFDNPVKVLCNLQILCDFSCN